MRKWHGIVLIVLSLLAVSVGQAGGAGAEHGGTAARIQVVSDGSKLVFADAAPFRDKQGIVFVPLRFVNDSLDAKALWEEKSKSVSIEGNGNAAELAVGSRVARVNGSERDIGAAVTVRNGRVYVPIRWVSEVLDRKVVWDADNATVHIWKPVSIDLMEQLAGPGAAPIHFSSQYAEAKDGKLFFKDERTMRPEGYFKGYLPEEKAVPDLRAKLYQMARLLTDQRAYTELRYDPSDSDGSPARVLIKYAKDELSSLIDGPYFQIAIYESVNLQSFVSQKVFGTLTVSRLEGETGRTTADPYVENRLRAGLVGLLGDEAGIGTHNWVMHLYRTLRQDDTLKNRNLSRRFDRIQADYMNEGNSVVTIHFSYL